MNDKPAAGCPWLSTAQFARLCGAMRPWTIRRYIRAGLIRAERLNGDYRINAAYASRILPVFKTLVAVHHRDRYVQLAKLGRRNKYWNSTKCVAATL